MGESRGLALAAVLLCTAACSVPAPRTLVAATSTPDPHAAVGCDGGVRYEAGVVEAALGHRAFLLTVINCGDGTRQVSGYPDVRVLDGRGGVLDVRVERGSSYLATDPGPETFDLQPGQSLLSVVSWSATVTSGDVTEGKAVSVASAPGETPRTLPVDTDLGTTGEITVTAWNTGLAR